MIQVKIEDSHGNDCSLNDLIIIHYPNPKIKFVGTLQFNQDDLKFYLDGKKNTEYLITHQGHNVELICSVNNNTAAQKFLNSYGGRVQFLNTREQRIFKQDYAKLFIN